MSAPKGPSPSLPTTTRAQSQSSPSLGQNPSPVSPDTIPTPPVTTMPSTTSSQTATPSSPAAPTQIATLSLAAAPALPSTPSRPSSPVSNLATIIKPSPKRPSWWVRWGFTAAVPTWVAVIVGLAIGIPTLYWMYRSDRNQLWSNINAFRDSCVGEQGRNTILTPTCERAILRGVEDPPGLSKRAAEDMCHISWPQEDPLYHGKITARRVCPSGTSMWIWRDNVDFEEMKPLARTWYDIKRACSTLKSFCAALFSSKENVKFVIAASCAATILTIGTATLTSERVFYLTSAIVMCLGVSITLVVQLTSKEEVQDKGLLMWTLLLQVLGYFAMSFVIGLVGVCLKLGAYWLGHGQPFKEFIVDVALAMRSLLWRTAPSQGIDHRPVSDSEIEEAT